MVRANVERLKGTVAVELPGLVAGSEHSFRSLLATVRVSLSELEEGLCHTCGKHETSHGIS